MVDEVLDVNALADVRADGGAVVKGDAPLLVDEEGQHPAFASPTPLQVHKGHALPLHEGLAELSRGCDRRLTLHRWPSPLLSFMHGQAVAPKKKWAHRPFSPPTALSRRRCSSGGGHPAPQALTRIPISAA